jgi:hypothetical protein
MLKFPQKKTKWFGKAQSGFYIDYIFKKIVDVFIRNIFIFSAIFFGEKYMIEKLTRKIIESFLFRSNKFFGFTLLNFSLFIYITLTFLFYLIIFFNLVLIIIY